MVTKIVVKNSSAALTVGNIVNQNTFRVAILGFFEEKITSNWSPIE
jgi:hypothetical protein